MRVAKSLGGYRVANAKDTAAFEGLFQKHYDAVLTYALLRADRPTAEEAAAETFLVAWRRRDEMPNNPRGWLLAVTRRALADQWRRDRRTHSLRIRLASQPPAGELGTEDTVCGINGILSAFAKLVPQDQDLLSMIAWDGLTNCEVAEVLGCSKVLVGVRIHRARTRLRAELTKSEDFPSSPEDASIGSRSTISTGNNAPKG
jgi:RNA polymerase sigma-70 factor (ECF subfamily)